MLKPCANISVLPGLQVRLDVSLVDRAAASRPATSIMMMSAAVAASATFGDRQALGLGLLGPRLRALVQADHDVQAALVQVQRVRVALAAVADDGDLLALERVEIGVRLVVHLQCQNNPLRDAVQLSRSPYGVRDERSLSLHPRLATSLRHFA